MKQFLVLSGLTLLLAVAGSATENNSSPSVKSAEKEAEILTTSLDKTDSSELKTNTSNNDSNNPATLPQPVPTLLASKTVEFCENSSTHPNHDKFLKDLKKELVKRGENVDVDKIFNSPLICYNPEVFKMTGTWDMLEREVMTPESIERGKKFYRQHQSVFQSAYQRYNVDPSPILGILRIETNFGENFGEYPLILFMYNYYFEKNKKDAVERLAVWLPMAEEFEWDYYIGGSHAGAFGFPQFMPIESSLHYSADGDGDGKINLFSEADAIHSVARYLSEHGWGEKYNIRVITRYNHSTRYAQIVLKYREAIKSYVR